MGRKSAASKIAPRTPVVIVGAGPVGLSMAILMQRFEIDFVLVERSSTTTHQPKARGTLARTMEIFRQWGVEDKLRRHSLPDQSDVFAFVESMAGVQHGRSNPEVNLGWSPSWKCTVSQEAVETELLAHTRKSQIGKILYSHEFIDHSETADGVQVTVRDLINGETFTQSANYLIACDGGGSNVRRIAGIDMSGPANIAVMANEYWKADLSHLPGAANTAVYCVVPKDPQISSGTVLNTNGRDRWLSLMRVGSQRDERGGTRTDDEVVRLARTQTGIPGLPVEVINRATWRLSRQVAKSFRKGKVFLAGDAAHRFPPAGAYGLNSGVQDVHNLAWKLAFVLKGVANEQILDTYDQERRPIAEKNADFAYGNMLRYSQSDEAIRSGNQDRIKFLLKDMENHTHSVGQSLGFTYEAGAVIHDGTAHPGQLTRSYQPTDRPGARFPHLWLDSSRTHSTLDWFDKRMVLVVGPLAQCWISAARNVASKMDIALDIHQLDQETEQHGLLLGLRGAVIVRPDGHVAWRMPWIPSDPCAALAAALEKILG